MYPRTAAHCGGDRQPFSQRRHCAPTGRYWPAVRPLCDEHGALLILDEVQTGFHRTGPWFACENWGVAPDIMAVSKALGNGFPIAAFITTDAIAASYTRPGASTMGGNPVSATAALAVIAYHEANDLGAAAERADDNFWSAALNRERIDVPVRRASWALAARLVSRPGEPTARLDPPRNDEGSRRVVRQDGAGSKCADVSAPAGHRGRRNRDGAGRASREHRRYGESMMIDRRFLWAAVAAAALGTVGCAPKTFEQSVVATVDQYHVRDGAARRVEHRAYLRSTS